MRGPHEHLVRDPPGLAHHSSQAYAGENIRVVPLPRHEGLAIDRYGIERAAARKQRTPACITVRFLRRALGLRSRIRQRKHDRPLVDARHLFEHFLGEGAAHGRDTDDRGRLERADRFQEIRHLFVLVRIRQLVVGEVRA